MLAVGPAAGNSARSAACDQPFVPRRSLEDSSASTRMLNPVAGIAAVAVFGPECIGLLAGAYRWPSIEHAALSYLERLLVRPGCSGPSHLDQSGPSARHGRHVRAAPLRLRGC